MRWSLLARSASRSLVVLCVAGCATLAGINDGKDVAASTIEGGQPDDASTAPEGGTTADGAPCMAKTTLQPTGAVHAAQATPAPQIDGDFAEWACIDRIDVGQGASNNNLAGGAVPSVEVAFLWTATDLYFYAHAITARPGLDNPSDQIYRNDSVHLFFGREGPFGAGGSYRDRDHQITIDHAGRIGDYVNGTARTTKVVAQVRTQSGGTGIDFQIEGRIDAASLGVAGGLAAGQRLAVNVMLVDAKQDETMGFRVWRLPPIGVCPCTAGCCERIGTQNSPTCDMRCSETLQLD